MTFSSQAFCPVWFSALSERPQDHFKFSAQFPGELNQISSIWCCRIKTEAMRGRGLHGKRRNKRWKHFKHALCQGLSCRRSKSRMLYKRDIYKLSSSSRIVWPLKRREKVLHRTSRLDSLLDFSSPRETFASDNLACSQLSKSHGPGPKMIYTHCFLKINHRALPSCKTDVRQYDCTVVVPNRGPLSVDMLYLSCLVLCFQMLLLSLAALVSFFFCVDYPRASNWLILCIFFLFILSQAASLILSLRLSFIAPHLWRNPPERFLTLRYLTCHWPLCFCW